jgi:hypothetical protein
MDTVTAALKAAHPIPANLGGVVRFIPSEVALFVEGLSFSMSDYRVDEKPNKGNRKPEYQNGRKKTANYSKNIANHKALLIIELPI